MSFIWKEVFMGLPGVPNWGLAGSTDSPVGSQGEAGAALVQRASQALNSYTVNRAIENRKQELTHELESMFQNHALGGVLVVAAIEVRPVGEMEAQLFTYMNTFVGIYAQPQDAISRWRHQPRLESPVLGGRFEYRFFWASRR